MADYLRIIERLLSDYLLNIGWRNGGDDGCGMSLDCCSYWDPGAEARLEPLEESILKLLMDSFIPAAAPCWNDSTAV